MLKILAVAFMCVCCLNAAYSQNAKPSAHIESADSDALTFSVATIRPSKANSQGWRLEFTPDGLRARNVSLYQVIQEAFGIFEKERLIETSNERSPERFDIEARVDATSAATITDLSLSQRRSMLRELLLERCKLSVHHESKAMSVYALAVAKNGYKLNRAAPTIENFNGVKGYDALVVHSRRGFLEVRNFDMVQLAQSLEHSVGRIVVDKTGLPGRYDFSLQWNPADNTDADDSASQVLGPSIFTALREQLGLELQSTKSAVDTVIIDHLEPPSEN